MRALNPEALKREQDRIINLTRQGMSLAKVCAAMGLSKGYVQRRIVKFKAQGRL